MAYKRNDGFYHEIWHLHVYMLHGIRLVEGTQYIFTDLRNVPPK
jgi:hypothetical protein